MDYENLLKYFNEPREDYYEQLVKHADVILRAYRTRTQTQLGKELGLSQSNISIVLKILIAQEDINARASKQVK